MNKARRKNLQAIIDQLEALKGSLEDLRAEEEEYRDNIPENMQESERYEKADEACDSRLDLASVDAGLAGHGQHAEFRRLLRHLRHLRPRHGLHLHLLRAVHLPAPGVWVVRHSASLLLRPLYTISQGWFVFLKIILDIYGNTVYDKTIEINKKQTPTRGRRK